MKHMKTKINFQVGLLILLLCGSVNCSADKSEIPQNETISFYSTPDLYELTEEWAAVFSKLNPDVKINVVNTAGSSVAENLDHSNNVSFVSGEFDSIIYARSLWKVVLGRDVIVPVINAENPLLDEIYRQGISPAGFSQIINNPEKADWGTLLGTGQKTPIKLYVTDNAASHPGWATFLETEEFTIKGTYLADTEELISAVQGDRYSIGICNITDVLGSNNHNIIEDVKILPIDKNGNGKIDYKEDVYADMKSFARGVWIGKYPRALSNNIYSIAASNPTNETEIAFLKWVITGGQVLLDNHGLSHLENTEQMAQIKWIDSFDGNSPGSGNYTIPKEPSFFSKPLPLFLAILLVVVLWIILRTRYFNKRSEGIPVHIQVPRLAFNEKSVEILPGVYYDKSHTWAFMDKDGMVKVGIDDFLQHVTGSLTRIKMKSPGEKIKKGKLAVSIIQDGKQLDICAPVSGTIKEQNKKLTKNISIINSNPHAEGWIYKIEPTNWLKEVQVLFMGSTYREWLKTEFGRLKAFLMDSMRPGRIEYAHVLQDGGELYDHILEDLGPEEWEDFQTNFIDVSS
jgi:glycine cleavage system H lipoate-binding protein/ABC-type phosphate transport system substrate-binding protein